MAFSSVDKKTVEDQLPVRLCNYTDVYYHAEITDELVFMDATASVDQVRSFSLRAGDVLLTKDSETADDIGVPAFVPKTLDGVVCGYHLAVVRPRHYRVDPKYLYWSLASVHAREQMSIAASGVTRYGLRFRDVGDLRLSLPDTYRQRTVARFLDAETAHIDELVARKRRLLDLLAQRMRTLGAGDGRLALLDFSRLGLPLPPNELGFVQLGRVARIQSGVTLDAGRQPTADDVTVPYLRVANVQGGFLDLTEMKWVSVPRRMARSARLEAGDVLMTEGGDPDKLGRGSVWHGQIGDCIHQNHVFAIRPNPNRLLPEYLSFLTGTPYARAYYEVTASKTTGIASTSTRKIAAWLIPLPPLEEQRRVVEQLRKDGALINEAIERVSRQLRVLAERRQALITAAVTGELDVSGDAA
ncbi:MAG: restriction endonuclease subunit S [Actinomycetota bacterium]